MLSYEIKTTFDHALSPEGLQIAAKGSHEALVWAALPLKGQGEPMGIPELKVSFPPVVGRVSSSLRLSSGMLESGWRRDDEDWAGKGFQEQVDHEGGLWVRQGGESCRVGTPSRDD